MKYKIKVFKQTTTLSELTVSITADSYKEAISRFNNNIDKVESSAKFKEIESATVFCVDKLFELKVVTEPDSWALTEEEFKALECLVYDSLDQWSYSTEDGSWDCLQHKDNWFDVNFWVDENNKPRLSIYRLLDNKDEVDYSQYYSFTVHINNEV